MSHVFRFFIYINFDRIIVILRKHIISPPQLTQLYFAIVCLKIISLICFMDLLWRVKAASAYKCHNRKIKWLINMTNFIGICRLCMLAIIRVTIKLYCFSILLYISSFTKYKTTIPSKSYIEFHLKKCLECLLSSIWHQCS